MVISKPRVGHYEITRHWLTRQFRWRYFASNGEVIGVSSESYWNRSDCVRSIQVMKESGAAPVSEE